MSIDTVALPVRPGEDPWTDAELKEVRTELESEAVSLHADLAKAASSPFLREYFQRIAEEYQARAQGELRVLEREGAASRGATRH